jgi:hypothetical protein
MEKINEYMERNLSGNNPRLIVNIKKFAGVPAIPVALKQEIGQEIIDLIRQRTARNIDRQGLRFPNYSREYSESIGFKAYGKSKDNPNLKQTGDMLGFMDIVEDRGSSIVIGWHDIEEASKAHGHITGNVGVKRDFFGLPNSDMGKIVGEYGPRVAKVFFEVVFDVPGSEGKKLMDLGTRPRTQSFVEGNAASKFLPSEFNFFNWAGGDVQSIINEMEWDKNFGKRPFRSSPPSPKGRKQTFKEFMEDTFASSHDVIDLDKKDGIYADFTTEYSFDKDREVRKARKLLAQQLFRDPSHYEILKDIAKLIRKK